MNEIIIALFGFGIGINLCTTAYLYFRLMELTEINIKEDKYEKYRNQDGLLSSRVNRDK